jgi:predicted glycosyltransferase
LGISNFKFPISQPRRVRFFKLLVAELEKRGCGKGGGGGRV